MLPVIQRPEAPEPAGPVPAKAGSPVIFLPPGLGHWCDSRGARWGLGSVRLSAGSRVKHGLAVVGVAKFGPAGVPALRLDLPEGRRRLLPLAARSETLTGGLHLTVVLYPVTRRLLARLATGEAAAAVLEGHGELPLDGETRARLHAGLAGAGRRAAQAARVERGAGDGREGPGRCPTDP